MYTVEFICSVVVSYTFLCIPDTVFLSSAICIRSNPGNMHVLHSNILSQIVRRVCTSILFWEWELVYVSVPSLKQVTWGDWIVPCITGFGVTNLANLSCPWLCSSPYRLCMVNKFPGPWGNFLKTRLLRFNNNFNLCNCDHCLLLNQIFQSFLCHKVAILNCTKDVILPLD